MKLYPLLTATIILLAMAQTGLAQDIVRLQDVTTIRGAWHETVEGLGVVTGLKGTGDNNQAARARLGSYLAFHKINVEPGEISGGNVALVMVAAKIPPFARAGTRIDVNISSIQESKSLYGGDLLFCTLRGPDPDPKAPIYVTAQGPVSTGGFSMSGKAGGNSVDINHVTAGRVPNGGVVVEDIPWNILNEAGQLELQLDAPYTTDFNTVVNIVRALGTYIPGKAKAEDGGLVRITLDPLQRQKSNLVDLIAKIQNLPIQVCPPARVLINERTGTIVVTKHVQIGKCLVIKGNLEVAVSTTQTAAPNAPFTTNTNPTLDQVTLDVVEGKGKLMKVKQSAPLSDVVELMHKLGATPREIIEILQNLRRANVLHAQLEMM